MDAPTQNSLILVFFFSSCARYWSGQGKRYYRYMYVICAKAAVVGSRYIVELCSGSLLRRFLRSKTSNAESSLWLTTHGTPAQNVSPSVRYPTVSDRPH